MIRVTVELISAITGKITKLGQMHISNTGTGTTKRGEYDVELFRKGSTHKVQRRGMVRDYPRQSYTVWELVRRSLESALDKWPIHPGYPVEFDEEVKEETARFHSRDPDRMQNYMDQIAEAQEQLDKLKEKEVKL